MCTDNGETMTDYLAEIDDLRSNLDEIESRLSEAELEDEFQSIEDSLADLRKEVEAIELPEEDEDDDDEEDDVDHIGELESDIDDVEEKLEDKRGPYAKEIIAIVESGQSTIETTRWTEAGEATLIDAVDDFVDDMNEILDSSISLSNGGEAIGEQLGGTLATVSETIEAAALHPDDNAGEIKASLEIAETLESTVDSAQQWSDLTVREQLRREGFYEVLDHVKDFPPEWHALKVHEKQGNVEMILLALDSFDSDFMEQHCFEALTRMGPVEAVEPMLALAQKRNRPAIRVLGKIGQDTEEIVEVLLGYVDSDNDPLLQKVTFRALGEIGSETAVQPIAEKLHIENAEVRSHAARALGLIGDTRAIQPLGDVLADDDEDTVRASAAWALNQIGTEEAFEILSDFTGDSAYIVQAEAQRAI